MLSDPTFVQWAAEGLVWLPERGMGYYPVTDRPYDAMYWQKYVDYAETELGKALTKSRVDYVRRFVLGQLMVVDIGIGCGDFVKARPNTLGFDINPVAVAWLKQVNHWCDVYKNSVPAMTFWDSLEHIPDATVLLANVREYAFISTPIYMDARHVLASKHFRRDEHCWYWTREGLIEWMRAQGFELVDHCTPESVLGREDIHTFAFRRNG